MANVLIVGCGDLGGEVAQQLTATGHTVTGVRASRKQLSTDIACIQADVTDERTLTGLHTLQPDIVIYCVAANAPTDESYRQHYVDGLRHVLTTQDSNSNLKHVFFVSSTRVYGQETTDWLDELTPAHPSDFGGERLLEAEQLLSALPCSSTAIRLSGIYGAGRLYLVNMAKEPHRWPATDKWTNRIHRDDAARLIVFLCEQVCSGKAIADCYIGTDDMPALQHEVLHWLAKEMGVAQQATLQLEDDVRGKRLSNRRIHDAGFQLMYANYQIGYSEILKND